MFSQKALLDENDKLRRFALRLTKNRSEADDLLQSTILRALEKNESFQSGTNLFSWMSKIMFNLFVSGYRKKMRYEVQYDPEAYIGLLSVEPAQEVHADLVTVSNNMQHLKREHCKILTLICVEGMSYEEASKALGIPVGTIRSRLSRARTQLQMRLAA